MLHTEPSFSVSTQEAEEDEEADSVREGGMKRTITIGESIDAVGSGNFNFEKKKSMRLIKEEDDDANGLILDSLDLNDGGGDPEEFYKTMVEEYPNHPLFLRNYAQLLQSKGDLSGAEDYFRRATLADPDDGESLSQYAKLVWELHHDQHKALIYYERAVQTSPEDSNILAAYARFLWETDDGEEEESANLQVEVDKGVDTEDYYRKMVEQNPKNSLVLRNYACFLYKTKQDHDVAGEYYSQAIEADPDDGETMSEYAQFVWEHRASSSRYSSEL